MKNKVFDIVPAKDNWERNYATMEYLRISWFNLWQYTKHIEVEFK